ncbi:hypothetical protein D3C83_166760 [compost metagenome]
MVWRFDGSRWQSVGALREFGCSAVEGGGVDRDQPFTPIETDYFVLRNGDCLYQVLPERSALTP